MKKDFIVDNRSRQGIGIEAETTATLRQADFAELTWLKNTLGEKFIREFILYLAKEMIPFVENLYAVPVNAPWHA